MTDCKVFYSWQSDLRNANNRSFIQTALENAAKSIRNDDSVEVEPVIDRDTIGISGSPDIANTIFTKIEQAQAFVCDVSIINSESNNSRPTPNPNVLLELGFAIKTLGPERIIMIMNTAFGKPEELPFDLRMRRVTCYEMPNGAQEKATERRKLTGILQTALEFMLAGQENQTDNEAVQSSACEQAIAAIQEDRKEQKFLTRVYMEELIDKLDAIAPDFTKPVDDQAVVDAIENSIDIGVEFSTLAQAVSTVGSIDAATAVHKGFEKLVERYHPPNGFAGTFHKEAFDLYKFVGHEFFVVFISFLIREEHWEMIATVLDETWYIDNSLMTSRDSIVSFSAVCINTESLHHRQQRLHSDRVSLRADLLNERHTNGSFAEVVPMRQLMDADCLLALKTAIQADEDDAISNWWLPWSLVYLQSPPRYLTESYRTKYAKRLAVALNVDGVESLKQKLTEYSNKLLPEAYTRTSRLFGGILGDFDPSAVGSRQ